MTKNSEELRCDVIMLAVQLMFAANEYMNHALQEEGSNAIDDSLRNDRRKVVLDIVDRYLNSKFV